MSKALVKKILKGTKGLGHMATIDGATPRVRPMTFTLTPENLFWTSTFSKSPKMRQIAKSGRVEISFMDLTVGSMRVAGTIKVISDKKKKQKFYQGTKALRAYFKSADDPNFTMLELKPASVVVMTADSMQYTKVKF